MISKEKQISFRKKQFNSKFAENAFYSTQTVWGFDMASKKKFFCPLCNSTYTLSENGHDIEIGIFFHFKGVHPEALENLTAAWNEVKRLEKLYGLNNQYGRIFKN